MKYWVERHRSQATKVKPSVPVFPQG